MKHKLNYVGFIIFLFISCSIFGQDISLYQQFNGNYDYTLFGNTLNTIENNSIDGQPEPPCSILTHSSSSLNLGPKDLIQNAYLYWAGSDTGDFNVKINGTEIVASRQFSIQNSFGYPFFSAFADITNLVQTTGNGIYNLSDLDLKDVIDDYCKFGGNFGGWAILVVYKNDTLPINQLNIYDGMQAVPKMINITLNSLNVIDNKNAEISFIAWEGDKNIAVDESLLINENLIGNPPLNPTDNAFNGTDSFIGSDKLYNMDLDKYNIQDYINIGDKTAKIQLTSNQDFVMINVIVTKINSQLIDATIQIDKVNITCNSKQYEVDYTVSNFNAANPLPSGTPIAIYANGILIQQTKTLMPVPINGSVNASILVIIPNDVPSGFEMKFVIDDDGTGNGIVIETDETNNSAEILIAPWIAPKDCFPIVYNYISANNDGINDVFFISGLRDKFMNFKLSVYNRWGTIVWTGNNSTPDWDGFANEGFIIGTGTVPDGTYYYLLELNEPDYQKPIVGYLYFTR